MKRKGFLLLTMLCCLVVAVGLFAACFENDSSEQQTPGSENPGTDETARFTVTFDTQGGSTLADITVEAGQVIGEFTLPTKQCSRFVGFAFDTDGEQMWNVMTDTVSGNITLYAIWEDAHIWGDWIETLAPGCETKGEKERSCEVCGKTENEEIDALGHDYAEEYTVDVVPTCEGVGSESRHCTRCDAMTDSRNINALGHTWGDWDETLAPGCETEGEKERTCDVCGKIESATVDVLGHDADSVAWEHDSESHWKICKRCNKEAEKSAHDFGTTGICVCGVIGKTPASEFIFSSLGNNEWELTEYIGKRLAVVIPSVYQGGVVTSIGSYAFSGCSGLTSITIPDSVISIGEWAFYNCSGLTSITIPDSVTSVGSDAFSGYVNLEKVTVDDLSSWIEIDFGNATANPLNYDETDFYVKDEKYELGAELIIPEGTDRIGSYVFNGYTGLTKITIPDSVTSIGSSAFSSCSGLTSITIPGSVTSIGSSAFLGCNRLISITIPFVGSGGSSNNHFGYIFGASSYSNNSSYVPSALKEVVITSGISIGDNAFYNCSGLTSITIPDSVTSIGSSAFSSCSGLTSITIPDSVTSIGERAFSDCSSLESITIPFVGSGGSSNTHFGYIFGASIYSYNSSYVPSSLKEVTITGGTSIGSNAFYYCSGLTSITIPDSVISIGQYAFRGCSGLTSITIPDSVTSIVEGAFSGCSGLTSITISDSVISIGDHAFNDCSGLTSITIPDSVISIGQYAFYYCRGLTSITIPDSVISIGEWAFYNCSGLTSITIPDSVTSVGSDAFSGCNGLTSITVPFVGSGGSSNTHFGYIFGASSYYSNDNSVPSALKEVVITGGTSIESNAFYGCSGLTSITIPGSVTNIGSSAFLGCNRLISITIPFVGSGGSSNNHFGYIFGASSYSNNSSYVPSALKEVVITGGISIGDNAFYNCRGLTGITIPDSVTSIGVSAFNGCSGLTGITIPNSVTSIGSSTFSSCSGLTSITLEQGNAVYHSAGNCIIETASGTLIAGYENSVIPNDGSVTSIGDYAFSGCSGLTSITIPDSVTSIGESAFEDFHGLTSIIIPDSVTSIGDRAFSGCRGLTSITIPDSVTSIGDGVFSSCSGLTSITIPNSVTSIGEYAFSGCSGLTSITIPNSVTSIGEWAFSGCSSLESITIPFVGSGGSSNTHFGYIFGASIYSYNSSYVPSSLKEVTITGGTSIGSNAFYYCSGLTSITIPDSVTSIEYEAFRNCSGLTSITIPDSVTNIGHYAFYNCSGLTIYCEVGSTPSGWSSGWNYNCPVVWNCNNNESDNDGNIYYIAENGIRYALYNGAAILVGQSTVLSDEIIIPEEITYKDVPYSVTSIGNSAFNNCRGLTSITIPDSVTSIGVGIFRGCSGLINITVDQGNSAYHSTGNCIIETASKALIAGCKNSVIPNDGSVTSIGSGAFSGCSGLTSITIPDGVTSIGDEAFSGCSGLTSITIPDSVTSIGDSAFYNCYELTSITIPDNVISIGDHAFNDCSGLTSITIPDSVISIGQYAFRGCSGLTSITIPDSVTNIEIGTFYDCCSLTNIKFNGTMALWNAIGKGSSWSYNTGNFTITCTDGTLDENGNQIS